MKKSNEERLIENFMKAFSVYESAKRSEATKKGIARRKALLQKQPDQPRSTSKINIVSQ